MDFVVLTLFPGLVGSFFEHGIIGRAIGRKIISGRCIDIRDFSDDRRKRVDDRPYGGGRGMVMKAGPLKAAIESAKKRAPGSRVILMSPQGKRFDQATAERLALSGRGLILVCGRYEGIDERIYTLLADEEMSIGDYVITGGELASMVIIDSTARLISGVLGSEESSRLDSLADGRLKYAQYTRPEEFAGIGVPNVLVSGHHDKIKEWRLRSSLQRTFIKRPDLFEKKALSIREKEVLNDWRRELKKLVR